jgi:hypothetical protein
VAPGEQGPPRPISALGWIGFGWGLVGVIALLGSALWRLTPLSLEAIELGLTGWQWAILVGWVALNAHAEGYRGFHRRFSPRVVARALHLRAHPQPGWVVIAPLFCMSLVGASARGMKVARIVSASILTLVLIVRSLDQPWRGIIDAGVVVGLGLGTLSLLGFLAGALLGRPPSIDPDLADSARPTPRSPETVA